MKPTYPALSLPVPLELPAPGQAGQRMPRRGERPRHDVEETLQSHAYITNIGTGPTRYSKGIPNPTIIC